MLDDASGDVKMDIPRAVLPSREKTGRVRCTRAVVDILFRVFETDLTLVSSSSIRIN